MIRRTTMFLCACLISAAVCTTTLATDLNANITSAGSHTVTVVPCGGTVDYEITGILSDTGNEGLAGFLLELAFTGGSLGPANVPASGPMTSFVSPAGITGPAGFGGAVTDGRLVFVGGAQNTIKNTVEIAPFPIGSVSTGVGHAETVLVTGTLTAPVEPGAYTLTASNVAATVIEQGEDGSGTVWAVEPARVGTITPLTVIVPPAAQAATAVKSGPACANQSVTLLGGPYGMAGYFWTGPNGFTSTLQNPVVSPGARGTYVLTVTDANNCRSSARTFVDLAPDPCEAMVDCNNNAVHDICDIAGAAAGDCDFNGVPDSCEHPGDFDCDSDVDMADFTTLRRCFVRPGQPLPSGCGPADLDADGDVDCADWRILRTAWTSGPPPTFPRCPQGTPAPLPSNETAPR